MALFRNAIATGLFFSVGYCVVFEQAARTEQLRYRVDVAIDTPSGIKVGSGIWGFRLVPERSCGFYRLAYCWQRRVSGDAIPIVMGKGRSLYLLLGGGLVDRDSGKVTKFTNDFMRSFPDQSLIWRAVDRRLYSSDTTVSDESFENAKKNIAWFRKELAEPIDLKCQISERSSFMTACPLFALVKINDPRPNAELVDPVDLTAFGAGYRLKYLVVTGTTEPISRGARLPWVREPTLEDVRASNWKGDDGGVLSTGFSRND